jgi:hypothetical protein
MKETALICAAFLGHPGAKLAIPDLVKPTGVVFKGILMKNEELRNQIYWLQKFGLKITWRAGLGVLRRAAKDMQGNDLDKTLKKTEIVVEKERAKAREDLETHCRTIRWNRAPFGYSSRQGHLYRYGLGIAIRIGLKNHPIEDIRSMSAWFKDEEIRNAMRGEIYPFLLGEYQ